MLVYSITSRQSFEEIMTFQQQILRVKDKDYFPIIVVGNKCDLEGERQVSKAGMCCHHKTSSEAHAFDGWKLRVVANYETEGEELARKFDCKFIETSAKSRINVDNAFYDLVREIRRYNKISGPPDNANAGQSSSGGPKNEMQMDDGEVKPTGCCGGCILM